MIHKTIVLFLAVSCLVQCSNQPSQRYLTNADSGKVIHERYYVIDGVRKVERRILVTATPRYETRLETTILGTTW